MAWYLDNEDLLMVDNLRLFAHRYIIADYIEFDWDNNGGFIDTGIVDDGQDTWIVSFEILENVGTYFYVCGTVNHPNAVAWMIGSENGSWYYGQGQYSYDKGVVTNQKIKATKSAWGTYPFTNTIYLGCRNWGTEGSPTPSQGSPAHFKVYGFDVTRGGTVLCTMRPAYDPVNQEWGMYDTTGNQFYGNAGAAGTSIAGGYYPDAVTQTPEVLAFDYDDPPASMWVLNHEEIIVNGLIPDPLIDDQGAFNKCTHLVEVEIPASVTSIGRYSFRETQLKKVKISSNCTYYDTSFPDDCVISFYPS